MGHQLAAGVPNTCVKPANDDSQVDARAIRLPDAVLREEVQRLAGAGKGGAVRGATGAGGPPDCRLGQRSGLRRCGSGGPPSPACRPTRLRRALHGRRRPDLAEASIGELTSRQTPAPQAPAATRAQARRSARRGSFSTRQGTSKIIVARLSES